MLSCCRFGRTPVLWISVEIHENAHAFRTCQASKGFCGDTSRCRRLRGFAENVTSCEPEKKINTELSQSLPFMEPYVLCFSLSLSLFVQALLSHQLVNVTTTYDYWHSSPPGGSHESSSPATPHTSSLVMSRIPWSAPWTKLSFWPNSEQKHRTHVSGI